jgi:hypothetical protein
MRKVANVSHCGDQNSFTFYFDCHLENTPFHSSRLNIEQAMFNRIGEASHFPKFCYYMCKNAPKL